MQNFNEMKKDVEMDNLSKLQNINGIKDKIIIPVIDDNEKFLIESHDDALFIDVISKSEMILKMKVLEHKFEDINSMQHGEEFELLVDNASDNLYVAGESFQDFSKLASHIEDPYGYSGKAMKLFESISENMLAFGEVLRLESDRLKDVAQQHDLVIIEGHFIKAVSEMQSALKTAEIAAECMFSLLISTYKYDHKQLFNDLYGKLNKFNYIASCITDNFDSADFTLEHSYKLQSNCTLVEISSS